MRGPSMVSMDATTADGPALQPVCVALSDSAGVERAARIEAGRWRGAMRSPMVAPLPSMDPAPYGSRWRRQGIL